MSGHELSRFSGLIPLDKNGVLGPIFLTKFRLDGSSTILGQLYNFNMVTLHILLNLPDSPLLCIVVSGSPERGWGHEPEVGCC